MLRRRYDIATVKINGKDANPARWPDGTYSVEVTARMSPGRETGRWSLSTDDNGTGHLRLSGAWGQGTAAAEDLTVQLAQPAGTLDVRGGRFSSGASLRHAATRPAA